MYRTQHYIIGALFCIIVLEMVVLILFRPTQESSFLITEAYAKTTLETCSDAPHRPHCYEEEVPKLMGDLSLEEVFDVIRNIKKLDQEYQFCHVLAHKLGEREVAKDPQNWIDVIARGPADGLCSNGFIHGAAVTRFNKEVLDDSEIEHAIPELSIACEVRDGFYPTGLDQAICYHGIGHVLVHLTGAQIEKSLEICDIVAVRDDGRDYQQVCDEGVFMQLFQPLEPEDYALIDRLDMVVNKDNHADFCARYGGIEEQSACLREGWPMYKNELETAEGITAFCMLAPNEQQQENCFNTILVIKSRGNLENQEWLTAFCNGLPESIMDNCFERSAAAYTEEDKRDTENAVAMCGGADIEDVRNSCYRYLVHISDFIHRPGSQTFDTLCQALPAPWNAQCFEKGRMNMIEQ